MPFLWTAAALGLAYVAGTAALKSLTEPYHHRPRYWALAALLVALALTIALRPLDGAWSLIGLAVLAGGLLLGYSLQARRFLMRDDSRYIPELTRTPGAPAPASGLAPGHRAVIVYTRGEAEHYDPTGLRAEFRTLDRLRRASDEPLPGARFLQRPFVVAALRQRYVTLPRSDQRTIHRRMMKALEKHIRAGGDATTRFYLAYLDDEPRPDGAAIHALNEGAGAITLLAMYVAESAYLQAGAALIDALQLPERFGVPVTRTPPLADSTTLQRLFAARACAGLGERPVEQAGVLLVGRGAQDTQAAEARFLAEARAQLLAAGFAPDRVVVAWLDAAPAPAQAAEAVAAAGATLIFTFAATSTADGMMSLVDLPRALARARLPAGVELAPLGAWNDDPIAIAALAERL